MKLNLPEDFFPSEPIDFVHGHWLGTRSTGNKNQLCIPLIPKNGTQTISRNIDGEWRRFFHRQKDSNTDARIKTYIILLREPLRRWISGVAEYCTRNFIDVKTLDLTEIVFDEHTTSQTAHLYAIQPKKCDFFLLDDNGMQEMYDAYPINNGPIQNHNETKWDDKKTESTEYLFNVLKNDLELRSKIKKFYKNDYFLLNTFNKERYQKS